MHNPRCSVGQSQLHLKSFLLHFVSGCLRRVCIVWNSKPCCVQHEIVTVVTGTMAAEGGARNAVRHLPAAKRSKSSEVSGNRRSVERGCSAALFATTLLGGGAQRVNITRSVSAPCKPKAPWDNFPAPYKWLFAISFENSTTFCLLNLFFLNYVM